MTENIIRMPGNMHREIQLLLPWYVTQRIDATDAARIEAHLAACPECRADLDRERRLDRALGQAPADVDSGWRAMRDRLGLDDAPETAEPAEHGVTVLAPRPRHRTWFGWAAAAQLAAALVAAVVFIPRDGGPTYHALGAATAPVGNLIVVFKPDTTERVLRQTLRSNGARLVDGPSAANAYLLSVPASQRDTRVTALRDTASVVLAEPIDGARE